MNIHAYIRIPEDLSAGLTERTWEITDLAVDFSDPSHREDSRAALVGAFKVITGETTKVVFSDEIMGPFAPEEGASC